MDKLQRCYQKCCRVCIGSDVNKDNMIELFTTTINTLPLWQMLTACTSLIPTPNDGLPEFVCSTCLPKLLVCYDFQVQSIKSDNEMRRNLSTSITTNNNAKFIEPVQTILEGTEITVAKNDNTKTTHFNNTNHMIDFVTASPNKNKSNNIVDDADGMDKLDKNKPNETIPPTFICHLCGTVNNPKTKREKISKNVEKVIIRRFECEVCKQRFTRRHNVLKHQIRLKHGHNYDKTCNSEKNVESRDGHVKNPIEYDASASSIETLIQGITSIEVDGSKYFKCEYCSKIFSHERNISTHIVTHKEFQSYKCSICNARFALLTQLAEHALIHSGEIELICPKCKETFLNRNKLREHIRSVHQNVSSTKLCPKCGKTFKTTGSLRAHLKAMHEPSKKYSCIYCTARFNCKSTRNNHLTTHLNNRPYKCDQCDSIFTKQYSLKQHKRSHDNKREFSCVVCSMKFNFPEHLKKHMFRHTGEKPYKCKQCEKLFVNACELKNHTRIHFGNRIYQCDLCTKTFRYLKDLRVHGQLHLNDAKAN